MPGAQCQPETEKSRLGNLSPYLLAAIIIASTDAAILSDTPVLRQILGFVTLTVLPGALILGILRLRMPVSSLDRSILSIGLSYSYLLICGLAINWLYPHLGWSRPLSVGPLVLTISLSLAALGACSFLRGGLPPLDLHFLRSCPGEKAVLVVPAVFPLLSIVGMYLMNSRDDNRILIILLLLIPAYAVLIGSIHSRVPERAYPAAILLTSISLVLILGLRSNHLIGADIHNEYFLFSRTMSEGMWRYTSAHDPVFGLLEACLSISILPAIYEVILNIDQEMLFKLLYPAMFSIVPLIVYSSSRRHLPGFYAMLASLFFMSQLVFLRVSYFPRTSVAILFFALSMFAVFHEGINGRKRSVLFTIFSLSCILSHYSTAYLFLLIMILTWIASRLISIYKSSLKTAADDRSQISPCTSLDSRRINAQMILLFSAMAFFWYYLATGGPFYIGKEFIMNIYKNLPLMFSSQSRGAGVAVALGAGLDLRVIPQVLSFGFSWLTVIVLSIGVLSAAFSRLSGRGRILPDSISKRLDDEFQVLSLISFGSLVASVLLPYIGRGYGMDRIYLQMMVLLSAFFVIGGAAVSRCLNIRRCHLLILAILVPYFLFNAGVMHQAFGADKEITLSSHGLMYDNYYIHDQETAGARWIKSMSLEGADAFSDIYGSNVLISQGGIQFPIYLGDLIDGNSRLGDGLIFIRYLGAVDGILVDPYDKRHRVAKFQGYLSKRNLVYSNGGSEVLA